MNFQPILDCFITDFKLNHEGSENIKADRVNTVVLNLRQIKPQACFGTPGTERDKTPFLHQICNNLSMVGGIQTE